MATVMSTAGEEPALVLAKYLADLAWADAGEEISGPAVAQAVGEATNLLTANRIQELLTLLFITADTVLPKASPQDFECVLSVLISLVPMASTPAEVEASAGLVAARLVAVPVENAALKLKLLFLLHNVIPASSLARYEVLVRIVKAASDPKLAESVLPNLRRLDLPKQPWWPLVSVEQKRQLYLALTTMVRDHVKGKAKSEVSAFSLKCLGLFTAQEAQEHSDIRAIAAASALDFLRAPDVFESDLLDVPAVHALQRDPQYSTLYQLLTIFLSARLADYTAFREAQPTALQTLGLVHEDCETKMRLLSLAAAAADSLSAAAAAAAAGPSGAVPGVPGAAVPMAGSSPGLGEIRYAVLQEVLALGDEVEVEKWVVKAISAGLVGAKMDQMRQTVVVSRASYRVFEPQQWQELRARLVTWKENIASVSRVAHQVRALSADAAAPAAAQGAVVA